MNIKFCLKCGKSFTKNPSYSKKQWEGSKYCGRKCGSINGWFKKGERNSWKGGRSFAHGYMTVYRPEHPNAHPRGYVYEHRLVMESYLGRFLEKSELVHHINGDKLDNHIENLELVSRSNHIKMHRQELTTARWKK